MSLTAFFVVSAAVLALLAGPLLYDVRRTSARVRAWIDGFSLVSIGGLALVFIAPVALARGGWPALGWFVAGIAVPAVVHRFASHRASAAADSVLILAIALHAGLESAALALNANDLMFAFAILAHRLPVGLAVFAIAHDARGGWLGIGVVAAATVLGFVTGTGVIPPLTDVHDAWLQALVAGTLLHALSGHQFRHAGHGHGDPQVLSAAAGAPLPAIAARMPAISPAGVAGGLTAIALLAAMAGHYHGHVSGVHPADATGMISSRIP